MRTNVETRFELPKRTGADTASAGVLALLRGDVTQARPEKTQVDLWTREAAQGSPQAQYELARTLAQTAVISADNRAAVKWLRKAVEKEHTASQYLQQCPEHRSEDECENNAHHGVIKAQRLFSRLGRGVLNGFRHFVV